MIKIPLLSSRISLGSYGTFVEKILSLTDTKPSSYVCFANVHMLVEANNDSSFQEVMNEADLVAPDGMPLVYAIKLLYGNVQDRIAGMDMMPTLLKEAAKRGKSVYFFGNTQEVLDGIRSRILEELPYLDVRGYFSPPFRALSPEESEQIISRINAAEPDLIFVALGCPKQEKWMNEHKGKIRGVMLGVGGAFNVYAGLQKRAPKWVRVLALEWVFRLMQEPGRLWRRYLYTNSAFLFLLGKAYVKKLTGRWQPALF